MARPDAQWCNGIIHCDTTPVPLSAETASFVSASAAYWVQPGDNNRQEIEQCASMSHDAPTATSS